MKTSTKERRTIRRQEITNEKVARQEEREAAWERRHGRQFVTWQCRSGDSFRLHFDFRKAVIIDFDKNADDVDEVPARIAGQLFLMSRSRRGGPD